MCQQGLIWDKAELFHIQAPEKSSITSFCALIEVDKNQKEHQRLILY
jgi:hypothetical protein